MKTLSVTLPRTMTSEAIKIVIAELELRWRERTPATRIDEVLPESRVGRSEIRLWAEQHDVALDETNVDYGKAQTRLFKRLRREFPNERWDRRRR